MDYIIERLKEASTWRSIVGLIALFGIALDPEKKDAIVTFGTSLFLLMGVFMKDKYNHDKPVEPTPEEVEVVQAEVEEKIDTRKRVKKRETTKKNPSEFLGD